MIRRRQAKRLENSASGNRQGATGRRFSGPRIEGISLEAKRLAIVILEVLAGSLSPTDAAEALGISRPRYYILELKALKGLVAACEPESRGRTNPEREIETLRKKCQKLKHECTRYQTLARAAQRTLGLTLSESPESQKSASGKRITRRPVVRALKIAAQLKKELPDAVELKEAAN